MKENPKKCHSYIKAGGVGGGEWNLKTNLSITMERGWESLWRGSCVSPGNTDQGDVGGRVVKRTGQPDNALLFCDGWGDEWDCTSTTCNTLTTWSGQDCYLHVLIKTNYIPQITYPVMGGAESQSAGPTAQAGSLLCVAKSEQWTWVVSKCMWQLGEVVPG